MSERTYVIQDWNCATQKFDPPRSVTLAQFRTELDAKAAAAKAIYRANVEKMRAQVRLSAEDAASQSHFKRWGKQ